MFTITPLLSLSANRTSWTDLIAQGGYAIVDPYIPTQPLTGDWELGLASSDQVIACTDLTRAVEGAGWELAGAWELAFAGAMSPDLHNVFALGATHEHAHYGTCVPAIEPRGVGRVFSCDPLTPHYGPQHTFLVRRRSV